MFNTTVHKNETRVTPVTRVVEKTITPDRVTDMYDKVRTEVEREVIRTVRVSDNRFHGVAQLIESPASLTKTVQVRFTLNGKEYLSSITLDDAARAVDEARMTEILHERIYEALSGELSKGLARKLRTENPTPPKDYGTQ